MTDKLTKEQKAQRVQDIYDSAQGSQTWYRNGMMRNFYHTDSVEAIAKVAGAYWLIDAIVSHLITNKKLQGEEFQVWKVIRNPKWTPEETEEEYQARVFTVGAILNHKNGKKRDPNQKEFLLVCEDGNYKVIVTQQLEYTDFPVDLDIHFYVEYGSVDGYNPAWVMMCPGDH
jgi:hypothetical protein